MYRDIGTHLKSRVWKKKTQQVDNGEIQYILPFLGNQDE